MVYKPERDSTSCFGVNQQRACYFFVLDYVDIKNFFVTNCNESNKTLKKRLEYLKIILKKMTKTTKLTLKKRIKPPELILKKWIK